MRWKIRRTETAHRTLRGARLATVAVVAGALATAVSVLAVAYVAAVGSSRAGRLEDGPRLASHALPARSNRLARTGDDPKDDDVAPVHDRRVGVLTLVDIEPDIVSLDDELEHQRRIALRAHERLLVWLVVPDCKPCRAVESALASPEMQMALARTRIVRLNATDFIPELSRIGVPIDAFPGFALLGPDGHATDYVHGGEWETDIPQNIAPVLKSFVEGTYVHRRNPWHGGPHEDETPI